MNTNVILSLTILDGFDVKLINWVEKLMLIIALKTFSPKIVVESRLLYVRWTSC